MPTTTRNQATMDAKRDFTRAIQEHPGLTEAQTCSVATFSSAIDRLSAIYGRLYDQVSSLQIIGDCYLGSCPADDLPKPTQEVEGAVNIITAQVGRIEDMLSALEGKIDRFRGRH